MKTKIKTDWGMLRMHLPSLLLLVLLSLSSTAQWTTNVNDIYNSNSGNVGIGTTAPASKFQAIGESRFGAAGNYAKVSSTGTLSFIGSGLYSVDNNKYVFKQQSSGNRGLFVSKTNNRFEFRDSTAGNLFHVSYTTGNVYNKGSFVNGPTWVMPSESRLLVGGMDATEGGQIQLSPGTSYSNAYFMDVFGYDFRIIRRTGIGDYLRFIIKENGSAGILTNDISPESDLALGGGLLNNEGGQIQLNHAPGGTKAYFMDVIDNDFRISDGTNAGSVNDRFHFNSGQLGYLGIGTPSASQKLVVFNNTTTGQYTTTGWMHSSDERLKTNIKPLENALDKIVKLQGVSYNWKTNPNDNNQIGFIAQEVEKVFPEVIAKDAEGNYSMAIQNLVAPIVEALNLQQQQIDETGEALDNLQQAVGNLQNESASLKTGVDNLENGLSQCCMNANTRAGSSIVEDIAKLEQNSPNPFNEKTIVRCYIPQSASHAVIKIYSIKGEEIKSIPVNAKGINELEIEGSTLSAGTYNYLLIIDGKTIDRKLMIVTK